MLSLTGELSQRAWEYETPRLDAINATLHTAYALREGREGRNALRHTNHAQVPCSRYD